MPDFEYRIRGTADVRSLQAYKKGVEENIKATKDFGQTNQVLEKELQKVNRALDSQRGKAAAAALELDKTIKASRKAGGNPLALVHERNAILASAGMARPGRFSEAFSAFRGAGGGIAGIGAGAAAAGVVSAPIAGAIAGAAVVAGVGAKALHEWADAEQRVAQMDAALAQSGQLNLKGYREELQEMAKALQNETGVAEGEWIGVLTRLTQFGARRDDIKGSAEAVKNLAGVLGGDLQSAALMVGKALQGEFASFSRLGIEIDQHATQAEKLEKLYGALSRMGGGQLAAANDTLAGSFKVLKNGFTDFLQLNGRVMAGGTLLKDVMYGLGTSMSWVSDKLSPPIAKTKQLKDSTEALTGAMISSEERARAQATAFDQIKESISGADTQLQKYLGTLKAEEGRKQNELDAKHNLAKAKIDADLKAGRITPAQAAVAKAAAEESHARASADLKKGTLKKEGQWVTEEVETERQKIRTADVEAGEAKRKREAAENMLNARGRIMKRFGADSKELAEFDALYGQPNPTAIAKLRDEDQAATERASKTRETSGSRIDKLRGDQGRIDADVNSLETIESLNSRRRAIERGGAVIPRQGVAPTIAANTAPGADPSAALETYQKQAAHWKSVADKLSRIVNISTAQAKQLDIATANDAALESRISMLEFQIQNGRR